MERAVINDLSRLPGSRYKPVPPGPKKPGTISKRTVFMEAIAKHADDGELPHELLLRVSRGDRIKIGEADGKPIYYIPSFEERVDCAKAAAPYFAPKLSAVEVVRGATDAELLELIISFASAAGYTLADCGIPETSGLTLPGSFDEVGGEASGVFQGLPDES